jgi:hypothetical protein
VLGRLYSTSGVEDKCLKLFFFECLIFFFGCYAPWTCIKGIRKFRRYNYFLTLSWPAGHICPTYKEFFQVYWDNSIPLFLHAATYLKVSLFCWTCQNAFLRIQMILCAMLHSSIAHSIICIRLFLGKMRSDWFNGIEVDGNMEKEWDTVIPAELKRLFVSGKYMSRLSRKG